MSSGIRAKMASGVKSREQSPIIQWIRRFLLKTKRTSGRDEYVDHFRHASDQVARDQPPPDIPGGVHHKIHQNAYYERDARRMMHPPAVIADESNKMLLKAMEDVKPTTYGPKDNFGLPTPVPGFGYPWKRNVADEPFHVQRQAIFKEFERYDGYKK